MKCMNYLEERSRDEEMTEADKRDNWCCMACYEAGHVLQGHSRCWPQPGCGTGAHEPTTHGVLD